jgi:response regulator RpfG family c-di-GMP phosphodiesterase
VLEKLTALSVDDERVNLRLVEAMARKIGLQVSSYTDPREALAHLSGSVVDLIFVDYMMPEIDGIGFIREVRRMHADIPIVMITSVSDDQQLKLQAFEAGATEFLNKPLNLAEFQARVSNLGSLRQAQLLLRDRAKLLEEEVRKATEAISAREHETLHILGRAAEYKDPETGHHISRVAHYSRILAEGAGLAERDLELVFFASPLHDVGKIGVADSILLKPGRLTEEELVIMREHTTKGAEIMLRSSSIYLREGSVIAMTHHEKWDGSGYPAALRGERIPLPGRIVAVADVFDALTSRRPYKEAWPIERAVELIDSERGKHFDPGLVGLFISAISAVRAIHEKYQDP